MIRRSAIKILLLLIVVTSAYYLWRTINEKDTFVVSQDGNIPTEKAQHETKVDTTRYRILFFGDSMVGALHKRLAERCSEAGYELTSVVWYSSTTQHWALSDTLQYFVSKVQPTYLMVCLGANQLFVDNLDKVDEEIGQIQQKMGNLPYVWVSPPNWKDDTGINDLVIQHVGTDCYFDSRHLQLARRRDHAHPTVSASAEWADTLCSWLVTTQPRSPLSLFKHHTSSPKQAPTPHPTSHIYVLQPSEP